MERNLLDDFSNLAHGLQLFLLTNDQYCMDVSWATSDIVAMALGVDEGVKNFA